MCEKSKNDNIEQLKELYKKRLEESSKQKQEAIQKIQELDSVINQLTGAIYALEQILAMEPKSVEVVEEKKEEGV